MVFGVSATTMVVVLGAGALALGPRDVPLIAKFLGRATGRAVAHVSAFTRAIERATSGNELRGIRADVRASIKDIRGMAREIERELTPLGRAGADGESRRARGKGRTERLDASGVITRTKAREGGRWSLCGHAEGGGDGVLGGFFGTRGA